MMGLTKSVLFETSLLSATQVDTQSVEKQQTITKDKTQSWITGRVIGRRQQYINDEKGDDQARKHRITMVNNQGQGRQERIRSQVNSPNQQQRNREYGKMLRIECRAN